jgi:hypothetical protein
MPNSSRVPKSRGNDPIVTGVIVAMVICVVAVVAVVRALRQTPAPINLASETIRKNYDDGAQRNTAENRKRITDSSNERLSELIRECRNKIDSEVGRNSHGFAVYFPQYNEQDLETMYTSSVALRMKMGRPSSALGVRDIVEDNLKRLREFPSTGIGFVVESTSDSFSGLKRWAGLYECDLDGLDISRVRLIKRYFMD